MHWLPRAFTLEMRCLIVVCVVACSGGTSEQVRTPVGSDLELGNLGGTVHATPPAADAAVAAKPEVGAPVPPVPAGLDFAEQAKLLYRIAACGGDSATRVPESFAMRTKIVPIVERHCKNILQRIGEFRAAYFEKHRGWFEGNVPKDIPKTIVYPFGGGDLLSALVAFPDATEITTISLEHSGDPRRITDIDPNRLQASLAAIRVEIGGLLSVGSNTSENLSQQQRNELPSQVMSFLIGLVAGGFDVVGMRYLTLDDKGGIVYIDQAAIDAVDRKRGKPLKGDWVSPSFSEAFSHVEITYKRPNETQLRTHRHFGWNLADDYLAVHPQLVKHLAAKGKVTMLVKGASYLLQRPNFSTIRTYMLDHLAWMLSDSTGIAPTYATPAGMVQETFGYYSGAFLEGARFNKHDQSFIALWRKNPHKKLGFRFGYVDLAGAAHLVITRPKS